MTNFLRQALNAKADEREELFEDEEAEADADEDDEGYDTSPDGGSRGRRRIGVAEFQQILSEKMELLDMDEVHAAVPQRGLLRRRRSRTKCCRPRC